MHINNNLFLYQFHSEINKKNNTKKRPHKQIAFCANNENVEKYYQAYKGKMLPTAEMYISRLNSEQRAKNEDLYGAYHNAYIRMEKCHTVEELRKNYPHELGQLRAASDETLGFRTPLVRRLIEKAKQAKENGDYLFLESEDNDLSVYLAKKIFFEVKTKDEIETDILKNINPKYFNNEELEQFKNPKGVTQGGRIIPYSYYNFHGLTTPQSLTAGRLSLIKSKEEYSQIRPIYTKSEIKTLQKEIDILTGKTEKMTQKYTISPEYLENKRYAMYYAWNESFELRKAMSEYLATHSFNKKLLMPDLLNLEGQNNEKHIKTQFLSQRMKDFWALNPELRDLFSKKVSEGYYKAKEARDNGIFEELKKEIEIKRKQMHQELFDEIKKKRLESFKKYLNLKKQRAKQERIAEEAKLLQTQKNEALDSRMRELCLSVPVPPQRAQKVFVQMRKYINEATTVEEAQARAVQIGIEYVCNAQEKIPQIFLSKICGEYFDEKVIHSNLISGLRQATNKDNNILFKKKDKKQQRDQKILSKVLTIARERQFSKNNIFTPESLQIENAVLETIEKFKKVIIQGCLKESVEKKKFKQTDYERLLFAHLYDFVPESIISEIPARYYAEIKMELLKIKWDDILREYTKSIDSVIDKITRREFSFELNQILSDIRKNAPNLAKKVK